MGLLIVLVVGGVLGWLSGVMRRSASSGIALNVILGIIGAVLGAFFLGPLLGGGNLLDAVIDPMTAVVALVGAVALLGSVHLVRQRFRRREVEDVEEGEEDDLLQTPLPARREGDFGLTAARR